MKKREEPRRRVRTILLTIAAVVVVVFILIPLLFSWFDGRKFGNVALIPIEGVITADGGKFFGQDTVRSSTIVEFIEAAEKNSPVKVILLEINSPGGSAVASDEVAAAVKRAEKPVITVIRDVGASGGYWIASATDYIIANRMSITGSIGVISSYLEFSGLMEKYGVGYEQLTAGKYKDIGTPFQKLGKDERTLLQKKLNTIHEFFIEEIAVNRQLDQGTVRELATGEFFLGVEALQLGLVDKLGDKTTAEEYIKQMYGLENIDYVLYEEEHGLLAVLTGVVQDFSFSLGQGLGSLFVEQNNKIMLTWP